MDNMWIHKWDLVLVNWEPVWTVWFDNNKWLHVVFDTEHSTITGTDITINWKKFTILEDHSISPEERIGQVDVIAPNELPTFKPKQATHIDSQLWGNTSSDLIIPNRYEGRIWTLNENEWWIKQWDPVLVNWESVWTVWFDNEKWFYVVFDENHTTIDSKDYDKITIGEPPMPFTIIEPPENHGNEKNYMISPIVTLPEVAIVDTAIESGRMFNLEDITVYLWKDLNTGILVDTINDLANNGTEEQKTKIGKLKAVLCDKSKNLDWSSPMVESFQKNELSIWGLWHDWKFWVQTFEKTKQWLGILPNGWIKTWKVEDYNWLKEIYKVRGKNLIDKTTNTVNTFSNQIWAQFDIKQNVTLQGLTGLKNFVLFNDWKIKVPNEFASVINWQDSEWHFHELKWNNICDWKSGITWDWKPCIKISHNNVSMFDIPIENIA